MKAILGQKPAINFTTNMYLEGLEVLRYHLTPSQSQTRAIFQQQYVQNMRDGVKSLESLVSNKTGTRFLLNGIIQNDISRSRVKLSKSCQITLSPSTRIKRFHLFSQNK